MSKRPQPNSLPSTVKNYFLREGELSFRSIQEKLTGDGIKQKDGKEIPISTVRRVVYGLQKTIPALEKKISEQNGKTTITFALNKKKHQKLLQQRLQQIEKESTHVQEMSS